MEQKGKVESEWEHLSAKGNNGKTFLSQRKFCLCGLSHGAVPHRAELQPSSL